MNKYKVLEDIKREKQRHLQWMERAQSIVGGDEIGEKAFPLDATSCDFGYWFYGDSALPLSMLDELSIKEMESKHKSLHSYYREIFYIYYKTINQPYLKKLYVRSASVLEEDKIVAMEKLIYLEAISHEFIGYMHQLEENLTLMVEANDVEEVS